MQRSKIFVLFDHLVGDQQQITRNFEIEISGSFEIDDVARIWSAARRAGRGLLSFESGGTTRVAPTFCLRTRA